jgi:hypothetical protein
LCLLAGSFLTNWLFTSQFFDISYDGQAYHQEAIFKLQQGWNSVYQQLSNSETAGLSRWLNHYPKASWIWSASLLLVTGNIEQAKPFTLWLMFLVFSFVWSFCSRLKRLPKWAGLLVSLVAAVNPVGLYQGLSFYLDGQLASILTIVACMLVMYLLLPRKIILANLFLALIVVANLKLTTVVFVVVMIVPTLFYLYQAARLRDLGRLLLTVTLAGVVGWGVIGLNPYVTNTVYKGHPLYPAAGKGAIKFDDSNVPGNWLKKSSPERMMLSAFAKSANLRGKDTVAELKTPFTWTDDELKTFGATNSKEGGWGPLFGAALIVSLVVVLLAATSEADHQILGLVLVAMFVLSLSVAIFPLASVARYVPQFWLAPVMALLLGFISRKLLPQLASLLLAVVLGLNLFLIGQQYFFYNQLTANIWQSRLSDLSVKTVAKPLIVSFGQFDESGKHRFSLWNIKFLSVSADSCQKPKRLFPESIIESCQ